MKHWSFPSSDPGVPPYLIQEDDNKWKCECRGFLHQGHCYHIDTIRNYEKYDIEYLGEY
jgi:hypothetical protein